MGRKTKHLEKIVSENIADVPDHLTKREKAEILYRKHKYTLSAIGEFVGLTRERLRQIANEVDQGISLPAFKRARKNREIVEYVVRLYKEEGMSGTKIAKMLNKTPSAIYTMLHRRGIRSRRYRRIPV